MKEAHHPRGRGRLTTEAGAFVHSECLADLMLP